MLDNVRAKDAVAFLAHLRKIWIESDDLWASPYGQVPFTHYAFLHRTLLSLEKVILLSESTDDDGVIKCACFKFIVFIHTKLGAHRIANDSTGGFPKYENDREILSEFQRQMDTADRFLRKACPRISFRSGHDYSAEEGDEDEWYWNTAAAWREMWQGYSTECVSITDDLKNCKHRRMFPIMKALLRQAHEETRSLCQIATGGRLPVELVDTVHEFLLVAEEVPLDRTVATPAKTTEGKDISWDSDDSGCDDDDAGGHEDDSMNRKPVLLAPYRCQCMRTHDSFQDWGAEDAQ